MEYIVERVRVGDGQRLGGPEVKDKELLLQGDSGRGPEGADPHRVPGGCPPPTPPEI
jgi:hypothetical protein